MLSFKYLFLSAIMCTQICLIILQFIISEQQNCQQLSSQMYGYYKETGQKQEQNQKVSQSSNDSKKTQNQKQQSIDKVKKQHVQIQKVEEVIIQKQSQYQNDFFQVSRGKQCVSQPKPFDSQKLIKIRKSQISGQDLSKLRISSDEIVCISENDKSLVQSLTCPICMLMLQPPYYQCQGCSNNFCLECLQSWWRKSQSTNGCPFKCENIQFKQVKRSNTYNAVAMMLKVQCKYCKQHISITDMSLHLSKSCLKLQEYCRFCDKQMDRQLIQKHEQQLCQKRPWMCPHCSTQYSYDQNQNHESVCPQKQFPCRHIGCTQKIRRKNQNQHDESCQHKLVKCKWCDKQMKLLQLSSHDNNCDFRLQSCHFCHENQYSRDAYQHFMQCDKRTFQCRLCKKMIIHYDVQSHKMECVFNQIIRLNKRNQDIQMQNVRLKERVILLQGIIEECVANNKSSTIKVVSQMRQQQKKIVQKDLLRLDNSIKSVQKLKKQQVANHMKFPHLIQSWCPVCKDLDKKFKAMLDPLLQQRKEVLHKMSQIQRFSYTLSGQ